MLTKFGTILRIARKTYHTLPIGPLRKITLPLSMYIRKLEVGKVVIHKIDGVTFRLDLGELIDYAIYKQGCFEKETHDRLNELTKPGMAILDVGANVGAHTFFMAKNVAESGKVYAFEPATYAFKKLSVNSKLNPNLNVILYRMGLSSKREKDLTCNTFSSWRIDGKTHPDDIHHPVMEKARGRKDTINLIPLDDWMKENNIINIDLIKLDIDGNEIEFFEGSKLTIEKHKPTILFEWAEGILQERGYSGMQIFNLLSNLGYRFEYENGKPLIPDSEHSEIKNIIKTKPKHSLNVVAIAPSRS